MMKLKNVKLQDKFEVRGRFKLEGKRFEGVFKSDGSYFQLSISQDCADKVIKVFHQLHFYTVDGEILLLQHGTNTKRHQNFAGMCELEYVFQVFWVLVDSPNIPKKFMSAKVKFSGLKEYIQMPAFNIEYEFEENTYQIKVSDEQEREINTKLQDRTLFVLSNGQIKSNQYQEVSFQYDNWLKLEYFRACSADQCLKDLMDLVYLFSFMTHERHQVEEVVLTSIDKEAVKQHRYKIFFKAAYTFNSYHKTTHVYEVNRFINRYFGKIYQFYCENQNLFEDTFASFIELMYTTQFTDHYLAELLKISEGVHRRFTGKQGTTLLKRYKALLSTLDPSLQDYLKSLVHYSKSLNKYLKNYRNYYSHYFPSEQKPHYQSDQDQRIIEYVLQLHKGYIFSAMGIPATEIINLLKVTHE